MPTVSIADQGRAPEGPAEAAREKGPWGDAVDPDGDCKFELEPREDKVRIIVPGKTHILSAEIGHVNAPRHASRYQRRFRCERAGRRHQPPGRESDDDRSIPLITGPGS